MHCSLLLLLYWLDWMIVAILHQTVAQLVRLSVTQ